LAHDVDAQLRRSPIFVLAPVALLVFCATAASNLARLEIAYRDRNIHVLPELNGGLTLASAFEELKLTRKQSEARSNGKTFAA
jgi:hypothetical protein